MYMFQTCTLTSLLGSISYSEFCDIMKKEIPNTKNDLVLAFKKMDINGDGFISFCELKKALTMVCIFPYIYIIEIRMC